MTRTLRFAALLALLAGRLPAGERVVPFWPNEIPAAIRAEIDGNAAFETVREISRFHRVHGSPGMAAAAELMAGKLRSAGLSEVEVLHFPADGRTRYAHFRSYLGWSPDSASLEESSPERGLVSRFPDLPVSLADYSQDADVTAELVDVGAGLDPRDYAGKDVRGKIVLASGPLPRVHRLACEERGAAGFLSDFPNQTTAWSGDDRDLVRWGHLSPYQTANRFAFMLSRRQADEYRRRLASGTRVVLRARVRARMVAASYDVVSATIPGAGVDSREIVLTAHLCHESAGANDNASGSAAIFEVARALRAAIGRGTLPTPTRTIRFLWLPEIAGSQAWLVSRPEIARRLVAGIHMDMVGGLLATTRGTFHLSRSAESLPHVENVIARAWLDHVVRASAKFAERGGNASNGLVWAPGSREAFLADFRSLEMGSDHEVFEDSSFGVPMVYFHDWPDVTIHTNKDQPENLDATKLGRISYLGAGIAWTLAALPQSEAGRLLDLSRAQAEAELALAGATSDAAERAVARREAISQGNRTLRSLAELWPVPVKPLREEAPTSVTPSAAARDVRVPGRSRGVRGPMTVYYFDQITEVLGDSAPRPALELREGGDVLAFEALNLADGHRTVSEIAEVLSVRYGSVPLEDVQAYLDLLTRAKALVWSSQSSPGGRGD